MGRSALLRSRPTSLSLGLNNTHMSLAAQLPGIELYSAIFSAFQGRADLTSNGVPVIIEAPILIQGEAKAWGGSNAIVVVSEATNDFCVITNGVKVFNPGALYYKNSRQIFSYLKSKRLVDIDVAINIQGIFAEEDGHSNQLVLEGPGFDEFVDLGAGLPYLNDARILILRKEISEIDERNKKKTSTITHSEAKRYERDSKLSKLLKELRGYKCQICGYTFETINGGHYSECHHLEALSHKGLDVSKNMLVVCANCHRKMHYGRVRILEHNDSHIVVELDGESHTCAL